MVGLLWVVLSSITLINQEGQPARKTPGRSPGRLGRMTYPESRLGAMDSVSSISKRGVGKKGAERGTKKTYVGPVEGFNNRMIKTKNNVGTAGEIGEGGRLFEERV